MKEKFIGIGLGVGAALTLGIVWTDSAQAFSLGNTVTVENFLVGSEFIDPTSPELIDPNSPARIPYTGNLPIQQGPTPAIVVTPGQELSSFGGIWDIDLGDNSISFKLNSLFGNVTTGNDVYFFTAPGFGQPGQKRVTGVTANFQNSLAFRRVPIIGVQEGNKIVVIFPTGFAPADQPDLTQIPGALSFQLALEVEATPVPTPALLPGLVGMGLAVLRQRREDKNRVD